MLILPHCPIDWQLQIVFFKFFHFLAFALDQRFLKFDQILKIVTVLSFFLVFQLPVFAIFLWSTPSKFDSSWLFPCFFFLRIFFFRFLLKIYNFQQFLIPPVYLTLQWLFLSFFNGAVILLTHFLIISFVLEPVLVYVILFNQLLKVTNYLVLHISVLYSVFGTSLVLLALFVYQAPLREFFFFVPNSFFSYFPLGYIIMYHI